MNRPTPTDRHDEQGIVTLEFVLWTPVLLLVLGLVVIGGRVANGDLELQSVARAAARAASVQRSETQAVTAAQAAAKTSLASSGVSCRHYNLTLTPGRPGGVDRAQLVCVVSLSSVDFVGVGPSKTIRATATSPVDYAREFR